MPVWDCKDIMLMPPGAAPHISNPPTITAAVDATAMNVKGEPTQYLCGDDRQEASQEVGVIS